MCITKENFYRIPDIIEKFHNLNQETPNHEFRASMNLVAVVGEIYGSASDLRPTRDQMAWLVEKLSRYQETVLADSPQFYQGWTREQGYDQTWRCAGKGQQSLMIDSNGGLSVCHSDARYLRKGKQTLNIFSPKFAFDKTYDELFVLQQEACKGCYVGCLYASYETPDAWKS